MRTFITYIEPVEHIAVGKLAVVPKSPSIYVDLAHTRRRIAQLQEYVEDKLLRRGRFVCSHYKDNTCPDSIRREHVFYEGTMSHVGRRFDLFRGDKPLRVVVVGQEAAESKVTLEDRYLTVHKHTGLERHYKAEDGYPGRNPHMRGTTSALRVIFGKAPGTDYDSEWVYPLNGKKFHIFDGFALVNRLLCFAGPEGSSQGRATLTMLNNCGDHLTETLSILQPTILILQGKAATTWSHTALTRGRDYSRFPELREAHLGKQRMVVCTFSHPSAREELRWADLGCGYLKTVVVPTLREALRRS